MQITDKMRARPQNKKKPNVIDNPNNMRYCVRCNDEYLDIKQNWKFRAKTMNTGTCNSCNNDYSKSWYSKNTEVIGKKHKKWREANPDYHHEYNKKYKLRKAKDE